jgi:hypothetical protein
MFQYEAEPKTFTKIAFSGARTTARPICRSPIGESTSRTDLPD